jgi:hypothetical protein
VTLVRGRPAGFAAHVKLTSAEAEIIDSQLPRALDSHGGTYNFATADLVLGGVFDLVLNVDVNTNGDFNVLGGMAVQSTASFTHDVNVTGAGNLLINCATMVVDGPVLDLKNNELLIEATSGIVCQGITSFTGNNIFDSGATDFGNGAITPVNFNADCFVDFKVGSTLAIECVTTISGVTTLSGAGHIRKRYTSGVDAAGQTYNVTTSDYVTFSALSADRTCFIANASDGDEMTLSLANCSGTHVLTIQRADTSALAILTANTSGQPFTAHLINRSGIWQFLTVMYFH